jgi:hypothetical protein
MENYKPEILLKLLWIGLTLLTIYFFGWLTFMFLTFGNIGNAKYNTWNLLIPNILAIGLLLIYTKEILVGYKPKSKGSNWKSLLIFSVIIVVLTLLQIPQFELLFDDPKSGPWQIVLPLVMILTAYIGIMTNRILRIKELKNNREKK